LISLQNEGVEVIMNITIKYLIICGILCMAIFGCTNLDKSIDQKIRDDLVGKKITYHNIAGKPINFTVSVSDIKFIEKVEVKGEIYWKVRVGEALMWNIYYDMDGEIIIRKEQLFVT